MELTLKEQLDSLKPGNVVVIKARLPNGNHDGTIEYVPKAAVGMICSIFNNLTGKRIHIDGYTRDIKFDEVTAIKVIME